MSGLINSINGMTIISPNNIPISMENFYISYNDKDIGIYGSDTTALVKTGEDGLGINFKILKGNHVNQYKNIVDNNGIYEDCLRYFEDHIDQKSKLSD